MTRPLRRRHRNVFIALGVLLPVIVLLGLSGRKPVPTVESLPTIPKSILVGDGAPTLPQPPASK